MVDVELHVEHKGLAGWCLRARNAKHDGRNRLMVFKPVLIDVLQVFRQLNSVTVPTMVSVPKNDEEDAQRGNQ